MGVNQTQVTTGATPVPVFPPAIFTSNLTGAVTDPLPTMIRNLDATNTIFLGGSNVTAAGATGGFPLKPNESLPINWLGTDAQSLYALAGAGTPILAVFAGRQ
jgi:hypothetical protein